MCREIVWLFWNVGRIEKCFIIETTFGVESASKRNEGLIVNVWSVRDVWFFTALIRKCEQCGWYASEYSILSALERYKSNIFQYLQRVIDAGCFPWFSIISLTAIVYLWNVFLLGLVTGSWNSSIFCQLSEICIRAAEFISNTKVLFRTAIVQGGRIYSQTWIWCYFLNKYSIWIESLS